MKITEQTILDYERDGAVLIKGLCSDYVDLIRAGIDRNMDEPSHQSSENVQPGEPGRFFDDYCNWQRIPEFKNIIEQSPLVEAAAALMRSSTVQMFHDHVLVKEPGTSKPTPWHQDSPYWFVDGNQSVSFWVPVDPVTTASLRCVAGSRHWPKPVLPVRWLQNEDFFPDKDSYIPVPDPDSDPSAYRILEWNMQPGDVVAFHFKTLHGARGNPTGERRRAFSLRLVGDDARYIERPGPTSPPFPGHNMQSGDRLRKDWFPVVYPLN
ncbi:MAG: ectoine hydroxylase-related dioxygenase (phytanoyl-CoA dioxygenase family) [Gammaproteobacteria bacterium]|jgi:ectoine hydroxylase-related dioxygenase (phytanoyl-CoA dioxygenase family)